VAKYFDSFIGTAQHAWVNKADTKFNANGVFKLDLIGDVAVAQVDIDRIKAAADAHFAEHTKDMTPAERKKWSVIYPFEMEEDDQGAATGRVIMGFKQNAQIMQKDGTVKHVRISLWDGAGKQIADGSPKGRVFSGATVRVGYSMRTIEVAGTKQAGIRLDFARLQIVKPADSTGGGFGAVEGGWASGEDPTDVPDNEGANAPASGSDSRDY
jgi:hypothetical protein